MTTAEDVTLSNVGRPWWGARLWGRFEYPAYVIRRNPVTLFGFAVIVLFVIVGLAAPLIVTHDPIAVSPADALEPPSGAFWFGTDQYGRDVFSRIVYATRLDLFIALSSVGLAFVVGTVLGALAGYYAGATDMLLMRVIDVILAFPPFILAMGTAAALGAGTANIIYVVALIQAPIYVRLARGEILSTKERAYADAARCMGNSGPRIIFGHLLPNCIPPILVQVAVNLSWAILNAAGLSFIGLGVRPPTPEWGVMINEGMSFMLSGQWWLVFFPGIAIFVTILGFNLLADGLRDVFDPRLRW
jgi:peptide/nickel transport system permease protein